MPWVSFHPWCPPHTTEMIEVFSRVGRRQDRPLKSQASRCPGCGAILNSYNADGICSPCNEGLYDFSKKINPRLASYLRKNNPIFYFKITSERARTLTERVH